MLFSRVVPSFLLACPHRRSLPASRGVLAIVCGLVLRRPRCLLRPVVVGRHGLIAVGCSRRGFCSSSVAVARRRHACLPSGVVVVRVGPVARSVGSSRRSLSRPVLLVGWAWRFAFHRLGRLVARRASRGSDRFSWAVVSLRARPVVLACSFPSRYRDGLLRLSRMGGSGLGVRLVLFCRNPCVAGRGRLVLTFRLSSIRISPRPSCRWGGAIFLFLSALAVFSLVDEECGHITGHDTRHRIRRVVRPILNLVAGRFGFHEVVGRGDELVVHTVEGLADCRTDTTDIDELRGALDDLIESGLIGVATVVLCEDVSDLDALDVLHCSVLSSVPFRHL